MARSLINVDLPKNTWVDIYDELLSEGVQRGSRLVVFNSGASDVRLISSEDEPANDSDSYQLLRKFGMPMINDGGSSYEWAYSPNTNGKISVKVAL